MTDSILSGVLTFGLLIGGTAAIVSETAKASHTASVAVATNVTLPGVVVTGHRQPANVIVVASR